MPGHVVAPSMRKTRTNNGPAMTHKRTGPSPHPSRDSCHYLCPRDPLAVDMNPYHDQSSCVDDRPTCSQCGVNDRKQTGLPRADSWQQRQIRKTALRLEHGRHRKPVNRASAERTTKGRERAYGDELRDLYRSQRSEMRRQNHRAKLRRYTPSGIRNTAVTPADLASAGPSCPHPRVAS
jgi:hypothetical protein